MYRASQPHEQRAGEDCRNRRTGVMLSTRIVIGLLGVVPVLGGCASQFPGGGNTTRVAAEAPDTPAARGKDDQAVKTKQVTIAVTGMT
jgi:hypothetical protein